MGVLGLPVPAGRLASRALGRFVFDERLDVRTQRRRLDLAAGGLPAGRGVSVAGDVLAGVAAERITPDGPTAGALLYLHGGAYLVGSPRSHRALGAALARRLAMTVWVLDYRLAPEHPHPAALDDALAALRDLRARGEGRLLVCGESAGGGLTLALAMALRDAGEALPDALGLLSPWLDLGVDLRGERMPARREPLLKPVLLRRGAALYTTGSAVDGPGISPLHGDLSGLPPIVVSSGLDDVLLPDAERLEVRARAAGATLTHQRHPGLWHAFHALAPVLPAAARALDDVADALRSA